MAKKQPGFKKITFRETPPGFAYSAPYTYEVPSRLADRLIHGGFASPVTEVLPLDYPARTRLIELGYDTPDRIAEALDDIKGEVTSEEFDALVKLVK